MSVVYKFQQDVLGNIVECTWWWRNGVVAYVLLAAGLCREG